MTDQPVIRWQVTIMNGDSRFLRVMPATNADDACGLACEGLPHECRVTRVKPYTPPKPKNK